ATLHQSGKAEADIRGYVGAHAHQLTHSVTPPIYLSHAWPLELSQSKGMVRHKGTADTGTRHRGSLIVHQRPAVCSLSQGNPMKFIRKPLQAALLATLVASASAGAQTAPNPLEQQIREGASAIEDRLIEWRRDIHQHPELGEQETRTAALVAEHLEKLGLEVQTEVGRTGVVGILKGGKPGRTVALRADMDALPVKEPAGLPFASTAKGIYHGVEVDVMHACGHDAHTAMLMATAEVLADMRDEIEGTVMFIFQPAEEGSSLVQPGPDASWGAKKMLEDGLFDDIKPDAIFALHVMPGPSGQLSWRTGATTAASDLLNISVTGSQGHGGMPWNTVDPIVTSAQVINGVQTVVS